MRHERTGTCTGTSLRARHHQAPVEVQVLQAPGTSYELCCASSTFLAAHLLRPWSVAPGHRTLAAVDMQ